MRVFVWEEYASPEWGEWLASLEKTSGALWYRSKNIQDLAGLKKREPIDVMLGFAGALGPTENQWAHIQRRASPVSVVACLPVAEKEREQRLLRLGLQDVIPGGLPPREVLEVLHKAVARAGGWEKKRWLDEKIFQAKKLENVRSLGRSIADRYQALIDGVVENAQLARRKIPGDSPGMSNLQRVEAYARRAGELTRQITTFSQALSEEKREVRLNKLLWDLKIVLESGLSESIELHFDLEEDVPPFLGDPNPLREMVLHLARNAVEAMLPRGGELTLRTFGVETGDGGRLPEELRAQLDPGLYAAVTVSDTGLGMDKAMVERIWEPLFTTKISARGVGLSMVQGVMADHGGRLWVESQPARGTRVWALFPAEKGRPPSRKNSG